MNPLSLLRNYTALLRRKITPVKQNRILFTSFGGHYSDSPKAISMALHTLRPDLEQVWLVKKQYAADLPAYVVAADADDPKADAHYRATARAVVDNVYGLRESYLTSASPARRIKFRLETFLKTKNSQQVFTTWHGTPLKCMGRDQVGSSILDFSCPNTTMLMGNRYTLDIMRHLTFGKIPMELTGTPRNDALCVPTRADLKARLGLPEGKRIVLFAPTFRSDSDGIGQTNIHRSGLDQLNSMDFDRLFAALSEKFGGQWAMVCRFHYHVESQVDWAGLERRYPGQILNGNLHDDMAEYLACTDLLLTDASSSMYDFALTGRPCLLFFPDMEHYASKERGFYTPIDALPFPCAVAFEDLLEQIRCFDQPSYSEKLSAMLTGYGFADDPDSSLRAARYIIDHI